MSAVVQEKEIENSEIPNGDPKETEDSPATDSNDKKVKKKKPNNKKASKFFFPFFYISHSILSCNISYAQVSSEKKIPLLSINDMRSLFIMNYYQCYCYYYCYHLKANELILFFIN